MNSMKATEQQMKTLCAILHAEYINANIYNAHQNCDSHALLAAFAKPDIAEEKLKTQLEAAKFFAESDEYEDEDETYEELDAMLKRIQKDAKKLSELMLEYDFENPNPLLATRIAQLRKAIKSAASNPIILQPNERDEFLINYLSNYLPAEAGYINCLREMLEATPKDEALRELIAEKETEMQTAKDLLEKLSKE